MDFQKALAERNRKNAFAQEIGFVLDNMSYGKAEGSLEIEERHLNLMGAVHGGALFTIADTAAGAAAFSTGKLAVTLDAQINYIRFAKPESSPLRVRAEIIGRIRIIFITSSIFCQDDTLL